MRTRAAQKAATRERLIDAARVVIAAKGVAAATVQEIASTAGVTTGALYASFPGKAELVRAVLTERSVSLADIPVSDVASGLGERLEQAMDADPVAAGLLLQLLAGAQADPELAQLVSQAVMANIAQVEQRLVVEGTATRLPARDTARLLQVLVAGTIALKGPLGAELPSSLLTAAAQELL